MCDHSIIPLRDFFADGTIPFFGSNESIDVHDTTSGSADSGIGLYLLLLVDQNMIENGVAMFLLVFTFYFVFSRFFRSHRHSLHEYSSEIREKRQQADVFRENCGKNGN